MSSLATSQTYILRTIWLNLRDSHSYLDQFPALEFLDLTGLTYDQHSPDSLIPTLPNLRRLHVNIGFSYAHQLGILTAVVHPPTLRSLTALNEGTAYVFPRTFDLLAPIVPHLLHFAWEPRDIGQLSRNTHHNSGDDQSEVVSLLSLMTSLESLSIQLDPDASFFSTLHTLPSLKRVRLWLNHSRSVGSDRGAASDVAAALVDATFSSLAVVVGHLHEWREDELELVESAAESAGIPFSYKVAPR